MADSVELRTSAPATIDVVLADDHPVLRRGLRSLLDDEDGLHVVGEAGSVADLVALAGRTAPRLALVDLHMPDSTGVSAVAQLRAAAPACAIVVVTMDADPLSATRALRAGALGYVLKESAPQTMVRALRLALAGRRYLEPEIGARLARGGLHDPLGLLSDREREVLVGIAEGRTSREMAAALFLSVRTVEAHRARLQAKLGISGAARLGAFARANGLVRDDR
jgi:two-component system response regulator NreC